MAQRVTAEDFEAEVLKADKVVLADFYSDSCVPCKRLAPLLSEIGNEYSEKLKVVKVNVNFDAALAEKYEVQAAPTIIFFKDGSEAERLRGTVKRADLTEVIERLI